MFADRPGEWLADRLAGRRVGVYGLDYVMTVRDHQRPDGQRRDRPMGPRVRPRAGGEEPGGARVRPRQRADQHGRPPRLPRGLRAGPIRSLRCWRRRAALRREGCGRLTMNMVLTYRRPARVLIARGIVLGDFCIPSLEIAGPGCTGWRCRGDRAAGPARSRGMLEAYVEYDAAAARLPARGDGARRPPRCVEGFVERGYAGTVTGHSIGTTMTSEHPRGGGIEVELRENMVLSMHPHDHPGRRAVSLHAGHMAGDDGRRVPLAGLPVEILRA